MPLPEHITRYLSDEVINELAILEDRALRAEQALAVKSRQLLDMQNEMSKLRDEVDSMASLAQELQIAAQGLASKAEDEAASIEEQLRRLLVLQAS